MKQEYTVHKLARLLGVSVRTLHYYDEIGLLKPSGRQENGYRLYDQTAVLVAQQIMFFRDLGLPLEQVKNILLNPLFNADEALKDQKKYLGLEIRRLTDLINNIDRALEQKGIIMQNDDTDTAGFSKEEAEQYKNEARQRWGAQAVDESWARVNKLSKEEYLKLGQEHADVSQALFEAMTQRLPLDDEKVQALVDRHYKWVRFFWDCPIDTYRNLGKMYVDDERFRKNYEKFGPGLAEYLRDAIAVYCDTHTSEQ